MARHFNLADLYELVAAEVPDRLALVAGDTRLTYAELDARTNRLARHFLAQGLQPGAKVAIFSWNRAEWVEAFIAAFKARLSPINVNYRYIAHELRYLFDNADIESLVFERSFAPTVAEILPDLPKITDLLVLEDGSGEDAGNATSFEEALAAQSPEPLDIERSSDDLYFLYTGGTTGMPKGVMWRGEDIFFAALSGFNPTPLDRPEDIKARLLPDGFDVRSLIAAPIMHGAAQWGLLNVLYIGGTSVLYTGRGFDPVEVWKLAEREGAMGVSLVGDAMARPLADALAEAKGSIDVSSVKSIGSGGAVFSTAIKEQLQELIPGVNVADSYGASETGASGTSSSGDDARRFTVSSETQVLGDDLLPVEPGSGIIGRVARTGHIPQGYYKDEAKTAATFVVDPNGVRWVVPGDFGMVEADGTIQLLGRGSQCINSGGEKIYPEEVEDALKGHPDVFDALVVGIPDDRFGERVAAVVANRPGTSPTLADLADHCRQTIAGYKLPRQLTLVDAVKRTPAGKANYAWAKETALADQA
ncbi:MAG: acyl-CoA synthetase (AMP-forming)/AMP-acid ligase [Actinomycetia bacterium]|nr:acyl-CoA synthetase (AMP-forming)/AMP-acid ligase [Actinomycetes bacterium]